MEAFVEDGMVQKAVNPVHEVVREEKEAILCQLPETL